MNKVLLGTLVALLCVSSYADDLKIADDFKSGDVVSAETFNQIFDTIEKIKLELDSGRVRYRSARR